MELKPGYKQTEVGVIPDDWGTICFKDSFDFLSSATYSRAETSEIGHICYVHYGDIHTKWNHFIDFKKQSLPLVSEAQAKKYPRIKDGDLVMADASEDYEGIGKSVEVKNLGNKQAISGLHTFLLRDKKGVFALFFKGYIHSNPIVKKQFDRLATGLKVFGVSRGNLKIIEIPLPSKAEQEAIAGALSDADELIASLEQLIEKKRMIKQGAMQELLTGKKRLPGFQQKPGYKQTEVGEIPEDWDIMTFKNTRKSYIDFRGRTPKKIGLNWGGGDILALSANNVQMGRIDLSKEANYGNEKLYKKWMTQGDCNKGDILLTMEAPLGNVTQVPDDKKYILSQRVLLIKTQDSISSGFLRFLMQGGKFQNQLKINSTGSTAQGIQRKKLEELFVALPQSKKEQEALASVLSDMDTEIEALEKKLEKARKIKAGMMHNLLTGTIRLV